MITCFNRIIIGFVTNFIFIMGSSQPLLATEIPKKHRKLIEFLFVVSGSEGEFKYLGKGQYLLSLELQKIPRVIMFSDRPKRVVKVIEAILLEKIWAKGQDSFKKDPPNAVLSAQNMMPVIITLTAIQTNGDNVEFIFHQTQTHQIAMLTSTLHHVTLTIDSVSIILGVTTSTFNGTLNALVQ